VAATQTRPAGTIDGPAGAAPPGGSHAIAPRRGLPGGRAVVGGLLVAVAAVGIFAAASGIGRGPGTRYLVAARDLAPGEVIEADDVELTTIDLPDGLAGRAFTRPDPVIGAVVVGPVSAGELIQAGGLADGSSGDVPTFSITIDRADANGGELQRGDEVQVFVTYGSGASATTVAVSTDARVVSTSAGEDTLTSSGDIVVRLAVPAADERSAIINATVAGRITLVRTTGGSDVEATPRFTPDVDGDGPADDTDDTGEADGSDAADDDGSGGGTTSPTTGGG